MYGCKRWTRRRSELRTEELFENQLCEGQSLQVELAWRGIANNRALGAQLILHTDSGRLFRELKAASGYLSGDPARTHFGFPGSEILKLEVIWPDGQISLIEQIEPDSLILISRP